MARAIFASRGFVGVNFSVHFLGGPATAETAADHVLHFLELGGEDSVGLGSDFDGIDSPLAWGDAGGMDQVVQALDQGGFSPREIDAICWENAWKFFQRTL